MAANVNARSELIMVVERAYAAWAADEAPNPMGGWAQVVDVLTVCPDDVRVAAWVKPWSSFKKGVNPAWSWEPVIFRGGRRRTDGTEVTCRDWLACSSALRRGFFGAKPEKFCSWICDLLGYRHGVDELVDLFPGSGVMGRVLNQGRLV